MEQRGLDRRTEEKLLEVRGLAGYVHCECGALLTSNHYCNYMMMNDYSRESFKEKSR